MLKISLDDFEDDPRPAGPEPAPLIIDPDSTRSTLRLAACDIAAARAQAADFAAAVEDWLLHTVGAVLAQEPQLHASLNEADAVALAIADAFEQRYATKILAAGTTEDSASRLEAWRERAMAELQTMQATRIPFLSGRRMRDMQAFEARLRRRLGLRVQAEQHSLVDAYSRFHAAALATARETLGSHAAALEARRDRVTELPSVMGDLGDGAMSPGPTPGVGPLVLTAGSLRLSELTLAFRVPGEKPGDVSAASDRMRTGDQELPVLLDLDRDGGLFTDCATTVNNIILRLLALLPAGQVKATIFDPARLGESASFLFDLGDAVESVIGTKVKTTERELADALLELEDHITFVTQKYLQGVYESLTDYNVAAGDVAEPYRLLVLYEFPKGFVRPGGGTDDEALARLRKIAEVGRRCGVFTLVVGPGDTNGALTGPLTSIPWMWDGKLLDPRWRALLATGDADSKALDVDLSPVGLAVQQQPQLEIARTAGAAVFTVAAAADWVYHGEEPAAEPTVKAILAAVERGMSRAGDVRVSTQQVAALARARHARDVERATRLPEVLPDPSDSDTWWHGIAAEEIVAAFGRVGASDVGLLRLDSRTASGVVIGGRPGSGKSVLIHALIAGLTLRYSPAELELYLVDFKEGVEFKVYAAGGLPHARVVAVESEREFGLSVLQSLDAEITRRGAAFREGAGDDVNLATFRARTGETLARIVLIVDEFHVLFDRDDKISTAAGELLDRIVRQGRAFGVHAILASQTIAGTTGLGRHTLNLLPIRIALQCSDADSRLLLADDNADARLLTRPGEGILNISEGMRDGNVRFQAAFMAPDDRVEHVAALRALADEQHHTRWPVVFEGNAAVRAETILGDDIRGAAGPAKVAFPVGMPMTLSGPIEIELRREPGGNLLVVDDEEAAMSVLIVALAALVVAGVAVRVIDFGPLDSAWAQTLELVGDRVTVTRRRDAGKRLQELAELVRQRTALSDHKAAAEVCIVASVHRARELDPIGSDESDALDAILRDGPDVGIHVVAWCDKPVSLQRRLSSDALREFGMRLLGPMSRDDSLGLVDSELASTIKPSQAVLDDHDRATTLRLRRFSMPDVAWVARACEREP